MKESPSRFESATLEDCLSTPHEAKCDSDPHMNFAPYPVSELGETYRNITQSEDMDVYVQNVVWSMDAAKKQCFLT
jgi:hypothetical protein